MQSQGYLPRCLFYVPWRYITVRYCTARSVLYRSCWKPDSRKGSAHLWNLRTSSLELSAKAPHTFCENLAQHCIKNSQYPKRRGLYHAPVEFFTVCDVCWDKAHILGESIVIIVVCSQSKSSCMWDSNPIITVDGGGGREWGAWLCQGQPLT